MLSAAAVHAIGAYQRYLSPYKGFCCASRARTGRSSCSEYARRLVRRSGLGALFAGLPRQFRRCSDAFAALRVRAAEEEEKARRRRTNDRWYHRADCDPGCCDVVRLLPNDIPGACDSIDVPSADCVALPCDCSI